MALPRSTLQFALLSLTLFFSFIWFFSSASNHDAFKQRMSDQYGLRHTRSDLSSLTSTASPLPYADIDEPANDSIWHTQNRTLGFQKIYAISMPHRTDKRDYLALMALISDLDIEFVDGVNGSAMHPNSIPSFWKGIKATGDYGCWRAHMDVYRIMVHQHIQSALVIEDDADWDVLIRHQMASFARGVRLLQNATSSSYLSPYGDNWDLLTLGHTGLNNKPNTDQKYWLTPNDPTVIAESRRTWGRKPDLSAASLGGDFTRVVMEVSKFTATAAYGISLRGAARLLYDQALLPNAQAIDMAMLTLCRRNNYPSPFCLGAYPMVFGRYRAIGPQDKDSDRRAGSNEAEKGTGGYQSSSDRVEAESEFTTFPVSLNIGRLMMGEWVLPANKPDVDLLKEIDLRKVEFPKGKEVIVKSEEYVEWQAAQQEAKEKVAAEQREKEQEEVKKDRKA